VIPEIKKKLETSLSSLGLANATFKIEIAPAEEYNTNGTDTLIFLFSANKGSDYNTLKKVASGGELSRIMLVLKSILARYEHLPTLMFDEIDSGVSGEISNRMGDIMHKMSRNMQVFSITHLPQIASKGDHHFKVFKTDNKDSTQTQMKELLEDERVFELAEMLGGKSLSDSALAHARELLN
jgi:DNA repair protein RecN (Recombination protein N)